MTKMEELFQQKTKQDVSTTMLIDLSNILHASWHGSCRTDKGLKSEDDQIKMWRYIMLNMIALVKRQYPCEEIVVAVDSGSWRKKRFQYYKARRKLARAADTSFDSERFFATADEFVEELQANFPYKIVKVDDAEADDVIGTLVHHLHSKRQKIVIISRDKDFKQLFRFKNVIQFDPIAKKAVTESDPVDYLTLHILKGDSGDDVPNMLSDDNVFLDEKKRQKKITQGIIEKVQRLGIEEYAIQESLIANYERNQAMVELSPGVIPDEIVDGIIYSYSNQKPVGNYMGILQFFRKHKIRSLIEKVDQFL